MERWRRPRQGAEFSHLLLDGGKLFVSGGDEVLFINNLAAEIVKGAKLHIVERRTKLFRLFFDLDAHLGLEDVVDWGPVIKKVAETVCGLFDADTSVVACKAPERVITSGEEQRRKCGFHVHFPGVRVGSPVALAARTAVIEALEEAFPDFVANGWPACVDEAVFGGSGLRLPWQLKGPRSSPDAVYSPWMEMDPSGEWSIADASAARKSVSLARSYLSKCSIRCGPSESATPLAKGKISEEELKALDERDDSGAAAGALIGAKHVSLRRFADVLPSLQECLPPEYATQKFTAALETDTVFLLRSSSKFCQNVGREHGSSNVYFVLRPGGISQHCYCRKSDTDGRMSGRPCREFAGRMYPVPSVVTAQFFGMKFVDDVPIAEHPDHGIKRTREVISAQVSREDANVRKRIMPSELVKRNSSVSGMMRRMMAANARPTKKKKK